MGLITDGDLPALVGIDVMNFDHMRCFGASLDLRLQHLVALAQHDHVAVRELIESLSGTDQV